MTISHPLLLNTAIITAVPPPHSPRHNQPPHKIQDDPVISLVLVRALLNKATDSSGITISGDEEAMT